MHPALRNLPGPEQWFHHGEEILGKILAQRPQVVVELGTLRGASAIAIARVIKPWNGLVFTMDIDKAMLTEAMNNVHLYGMAGNITVIDAPSTVVASGWAGNVPVDCLYIDADHTEASVLADLEAWWPHLRVGALVLGDDYDNPMFPGVTTAFDEWERRGHPLQRGLPNPDSVPPNGRLIYGWKT